MEFRVSGDWRGRQTRGYSTFSAGAPLYPRPDKSDFDHLFPDASILNNIRNLENPLQKNLADSYNMDRNQGDLSTNAFRGDRYDSKGQGSVNNTKHSLNQKPQPAPENGRRSDFFPAFFGITNFITGFFNNISGVMSFQQRPPTAEKAAEAAFAFSRPQQIFHDSEQKDSGFDESDYADSSPPIDDVDAIRDFSRRDCSKNNVEANQNKTHSVRAQCDARGGGGADTRERAAATMDRPVVADPAEHCRDKMAKIQQLLAGKTSDAAKSPNKSAGFRYRPRARKVFVDPNAVTVETYVDAFEPEALARIENVSATNFEHPGLIVTSELARIETLPKVKLEVVTETARPQTEAALPEHTAETMEIKTSTDVTEDEVKDKSSAANVTETKPAAAELSNKQDVTKVVGGNACDLRGTVTQSDTTTDHSVAVETKRELITSCEDKVSRLKALLSQRRKSREALNAASEPKSVDTPQNHLHSPQSHTETASSSIEEQKLAAQPQQLEEPQIQPETTPKPVQAPPKQLEQPKLIDNSKKPPKAPQKQLVTPQKPIEKPNGPIQTLCNSVKCTQKPLQAPKQSEIGANDAERCQFAQKADTRRSPERAIPVPNRRLHSKRHKNPNRLDARKQKRKNLRRNIDEDACFARDIDGDTASSVDTESDSPKIIVTPPNIATAPHLDPNAFDEVRGRFKSSNSESDDSFIIVFSDSPAVSPPRSPRNRIPSETGSEDSFIICFEDEDGAPPSCFTSEEVFDSDSEDSSEESDSDCDSNLASFGNFSRTLSDLTDESLYRDGAEVQCANYADSDDDNDDNDEEVQESTSAGLLLTEEKKIARRGLAAKKVRFSEAAPKVHTMHVWLFAARQARAGNWRQLATDNERFKRRIADVDMAISWVLKPQHRARVKFQRFMPWWHAQRRQEEADRKVAEEKFKIEEQTRLEEERRMEELRRLEEERRLQEERRLEDERRSQEEQRRQNAKKCKKKRISTQQFANNVSDYLAKMKDASTDNKVRDDVRVNGVADDEKMIVNNNDS